jgi:ABC-2 type transport system permease protein
MNSFLQMTRFQFQSMLRNKVAFFFNLVMPIIFVAFFGMIYGPKEARVPAVGIVNLDQGTGAAQLVAYLTQNGALRLEQGSEAELSPRLTDGKIDAILILNQGLSASLTAQQAPAEIAIRYDQGSQNSGSTIGMLTGMVNAYGTRPVLIAKPTPIAGKAQLNVMDYTLPGALLQMLMSAGLITVAIWLANQRQTGAMRHLFSTPLSMSVWVGSRILANVALAALQVLVLYGVAATLFHVSGPANLLGSILFLALSALATLGIGMVVGVFAPSSDAAFPISMILYMGLLFLGGAMVPLQIAPPIFLKLAKMTPSYYMNDGLRAMMMAGDSLGSIWPHLLIVGGIALVTISLATWRIRKQFVEA